MKLGFSRHVFKKRSYIKNFAKFAPVGGELFHADGQTDMRKIIVSFRNIAKVPKNLVLLIDFFSIGYFRRNVHNLE